MTSGRRHAHPGRDQHMAPTRAPSPHGLVEHDRTRCRSERRVLLATMQHHPMAQRDVVVNDRRARIARHMNRAVVLNVRALHRCGRSRHRRGRPSETRSKHLCRPRRHRSRRPRRRPRHPRGSAGDLSRYFLIIRCKSPVRSRVRCRVPRLLKTRRLAAYKATWNPWNASRGLTFDDVILVPCESSMSADAGPTSQPGSPAPSL